ncbi:MAG: hypothetical protein LBN20_04890 [Endomicrobium sp.]|jgi:DNA-binding phage protein|nr:hypothetical protein [Endomicrobium sp.]
MQKEKISNEDWDIEDESFDAHFAKTLSKDPERIQSFKKRVVREFNETKNYSAYLQNLKLIAIAENKTITIAQKTKMKRSNVYRMLSKQSNPAFNTILTISENLGIEPNFCIAK